MSRNAIRLLDECNISGSSRLALPRLENFPASARAGSKMTGPDIDELAELEANELRINDTTKVARTLASGNTSFEKYEPPSSVAPSVWCCRMGRDNSKPENAQEDGVTVG